ncbi:MAG: hypothetical protein Kow0026_23210 [Oricola sp.]
MDSMRSTEGMNPHMTPSLDPSGHVTINGMWTTRKHGVPYGGWFRRKYIATMTYGGNLSVIVDDANRIYKVQ